MRIISGIFKGKKILDPRDLKTRPLKDLVKESIFNIIVHSNKLGIELKNSDVLDLFSGVGSFGIECLSRGAKSVTFVENYTGVLPVLKENIHKLDPIKNYEIIEKDIYEDNLDFNLKSQFDLIFMDPPYKDKNLKVLFLKLEKTKIIKKNCIIILHRHKNETDIIPENFKITEEKKYGISKVLFITQSN